MCRLRTDGLHPASRFVGTMNYGYAGTRELNEALVSRFLVIDMPALTKENLYRIIRHDYPKIKEEALDAFGGLFLDLQEKADNSEISTKCMDLRGLLSALGAVKIGLTALQACAMGIINKAFDIFEREIVSDMARPESPRTGQGRMYFNAGQIADIQRGRISLRTGKPYEESAVDSEWGL